MAISPAPQPNDMWSPLIGPHILGQTPLLCLPLLLVSMTFQILLSIFGFASS